VGGAYVHNNVVVVDSNPKKSTVSMEHRTQTIGSSIHIQTHVREIV